MINYFAFVAILLFINQASAEPFIEIESFCDAIDGEKVVIEALIEQTKRLNWSGHHPFNYVEGDLKDIDILTMQKEYRASVQTALENIRRVAKFREELIVAQKKPSAQDYTRCCLLTCTYMSRNKNLYQ